ncbi:MAG: 50S ribosomal protein L30 [archaeon]
MKIAIIRVRGSAEQKKVLNDTFKMLRLYRKNHCVVVPNTTSYTGMIKKVKDHATWGEINEATFKELLLKRGKLPGNKKLTPEYIKEKTKLNPEEFVKEFFAGKKELKDIAGLKLYFKLNPPRHGFERKGIKTPFSLGGALGYRKEKINDLIMRMV